MMEIFETYSEDESFELAKETGKKAVPGDVYTLNGDLGAGKTVFAKGFAYGIGVEETVTSPTFSLVKEYRVNGKVCLCHFDAYRIEDEEEALIAGLDEYFRDDTVCLIEWADNILNILPESRTDIFFEKNILKGENYRKIIIKSNKKGEK